jgi:cold shock protein
MQGRVKWYNAQKGYGFIEPSDGSRDMFFHVTDLLMDADEPESGQRVNYEEGERGGKPIAKSVRYVQTNGGPHA